MEKAHINFCLSLHPFSPNHNEFKLYSLMFLYISVFITIVLRVHFNKFLLSLCGFPLEEHA